MFIMGTVTVNLTDDTERLFRVYATKKYGRRKGYLGRALDQALRMWVVNQQGDSVEKTLKHLNDGIHCGEVRFASGVNCMSASVFFDTNILVYAFNESEGVKWRKCNKLVSEVLLGEKVACVSNQVLGEFCNALTAKAKRPVDNKILSEIICAFNESPHWIKLEYTERTVVHALKIRAECGIHFWDAVIAATMLENQVYHIYTENVRDFGKIRQIKTINPLE